MKKIFTLSVLLLFCVMWQGCLKDTCTQTYTIYTPVYKTTAEVRANIKSNTPRAIANPGKLVVLDNFIFLNEVDKGIHIIDNSNPSNPVNKYFIDVPGNIDIAVKGNTLYADLYTDLVALDISNPAAVNVTKITDDVFEHRRFPGFAADTSLVIVDWLKKDTTVSTECAATWQGRGGVFVTLASVGNASASAPTKAGIAGSMARFTIMNDYLYTVTESALNVFNISNAANPSFRNKINFGWGIETIFPFGNNLFIGSTTGMFVYGTSNPEAPNQVSNFAHVRSCDPVIADDNFAYVTLRSGNACAGFTNQLDVINIQNIAAPTLVKSYALTNPHGLAKSNNILFVCDGSAGLRVYDASNVNELVLLQSVTGINTYDVIALNNIALVVAKDGLYQYDYTNPSSLQLLSKIGLK